MGRFSTSEVEQFRQIFHDCAKREANMKLAESLGASRSAAQQKQENSALTREGIRRLVRSLGISISPENSILLEHQLKEVDEGLNVLNFTQFLQVMRWMLDSNFADIND